MPILDIEVVVEGEASLPTDAAARLADAAALALGTPAGHTWVRLHILRPEMYAEDHGGPPADVHPVFVTVLKDHVKDRDALAKEARSLSESIAAVLGRPAENVHVLFEPAASGRIAFGGELM